MRSVVALLVCAVAVPAQNPASGRRASSRTENDERGAWVHGSVVSDITGQPLARAHVILRPVTGSTSSLLVESDEQGRFVMNRIGPGSYTLTAQRDGYLANSSARRGPLRLPPVLQLNEGYHLRGIVFRLRPWAVISGKVRYDDAEPAVGASVQLYREVVARGRHSMQLIRTVPVNDRGEYRVHGLSPGAYFVAGTRNRPVSPEIEEQERLDDLGKPLTMYRYATTFFPGAQKLSDAVPVRVEAAQEVGGIDLILKPLPSVRIRGLVINSLTGKPTLQANIVFRRLSAEGNSSIPIAVKQTPYQDGFEIMGVTSGPYLVTCDAEFERKRLVARELLTVTDAAIDNFDLLLLPEQEMTGVIRLDDSPRLQLSRLRVNLEPRSDLNPSSTGEVDATGNFKLKVVANEHYDAYVANLPDTYYVRAVRIANMDVGPDGIPGNAAASAVQLEISLSARSATIRGRVFAADGYPAGGATVVLVPDPARGRASAYQAGSADEYGIFQLRGVPPGNYTAFAFIEEPPCDYYDENELLSCRTLGRNVRLPEASQTAIELRVP